MGHSATITHYEGKKEHSIVMKFLDFQKLISKLPSKQLKDGKGSPTIFFNKDSNINWCEEDNKYNGLAQHESSRLKFDLTSEIVHVDQNLHLKYADNDQMIIRCVEG